MNDTEFHKRVDQLLMDIEDQLEQLGADVDCEIMGNVLTLEFDDRSQIVINRQESLHEIWVASKSGGYHFALNESTQEWRCTRSDVEFLALVQQECSLQSHEHIHW